MPESVPTIVGAAQRLGFAISVERSDATADAIQIVYEHRLLQTRIEADTAIPLG